jgi:hypothetical protein
MIRYRIDVVPDGSRAVLIALTDYRDIAEIVKKGVDAVHPEYRTRIIDRSPSDNLFPEVEGDYCGIDDC